MVFLMGDAFIVLCVPPSRRPSAVTVGFVIGVSFGWLLVYYNVLWGRMGVYDTL